MNGRPNSSNAKDCAKLILADGLIQQEKAINQILADSTTTEKKGGEKPARPVQVKLMFSLQPPFLMSARRCASTSWEDIKERAPAVAMTADMASDAQPSFTQAKVQLHRTWKLHATTTTNVGAQCRCISKNSLQRWTLFLLTTDAANPWNKFDRV